MVDKNLVAGSILPNGQYNSKIDLKEDEAEEIIETVFQEWGFQDTDALVFHGGPSRRDEQKRFEVFEETAEYLEQLGRSPEMYVPEDSQYLLQNSKISSEDVITMEPEITEDDISMSGTHESRVHVTSDYHTDRVERLLSEYEEDKSHDYLVLGAYTGDLSTVADFDVKGARISVNHLVAEGNEVRRKLQGNRF
jgi:hypothetical protein